MAVSLDVESSMAGSSTALATLDADVGECLRSDEDLAREINTEHGQVETYKRNTVQHAIRCGDLLLEMKRRVGHGNWLAWLGEHFEASERTARNYMEIAKSAAVADLRDDTTMRSALRALASPSRSQEPKCRLTEQQVPKLSASERIAVRDVGGMSDEVVEEPRAGLGKARQRTWASLPARLTIIRRAFRDAAGDQLDDRRASEALYKASREARQAAIDLEQLAAALTKRAA
jgi:hypothetical protein